VKALRPLFFVIPLACAAAAYGQADTAEYGKAIIGKWSGLVRIPGMEHLAFRSWQFNANGTFSDVIQDKGQHAAWYRFDRTKRSRTYGGTYTISGNALTVSYRGAVPEGKNREDRWIIQRLGRYWLKVKNLQDHESDSPWTYAHDAVLQKALIGKWRYARSGSEQVMEFRPNGSFTATYRIMGEGTPKAFRGSYRIHGPSIEIQYAGADKRPESFEPSGIFSYIIDEITDSAMETRLSDPPLGETDTTRSFQKLH